jgi:hypothetical protein
VATPEADTLTVSGGGVELHVTYRPVAGSWVGRVLPVRAAVYLDADRLNLTGQGNFSVTNLTAGIYTLRAVAPGHLPYATNISITYGNTTQVAIRLASEAAPSVPWTTLTPLAGLLLGAVSGAAVAAVVGMAVYVRRRTVAPRTPAEGPADPGTPNR